MHLIVITILFLLQLCPIVPFISEDYMQSKESVLEIKILPFHITSNSYCSKFSVFYPIQAYLHWVKISRIKSSMHYNWILLLFSSKSSKQNYI
jgi:hypothetical protein